MMCRPYIRVAAVSAIGWCAALTFFTSCYREKPTLAQITVYDSIGAPVSGATVRLYCTSAGCIIDDVQTTGGDGKSEHKFKAGTEYILFIEAQKGAAVNSANDYIQLEQRKTNTATVTIR